MVSTSDTVVLLKPFPQQTDGARFLSQRRYALLADMPRVGKTGASIMAADWAMDASIIVVTTASGCAVWRRAYALWSPLRTVQVIDGEDDTDEGRDVTIVSWDTLKRPRCLVTLRRRRRDRAIFDEAHNAAKFSSQRTQAAYGTPRDEHGLNSAYALFGSVEGAWALTGTPMPNSPADLYPLLRTFCPERLAGGDGLPDVTGEEAFLQRYTVRFPMKTSRFAAPVMVVKEGRNEAELARRIDGFFLRRTQQDVGIGEPIHEIMPLAVSTKVRRSVEQDVDKSAILAAAEAGNTKSLEMHMGPLRRLTGTIKAELVADAVKDEFDGGLDKIVLAYWHRDVGDMLADLLRPLGVLRIDGATSKAEREQAELLFREKRDFRVMLAQIQAAGEAIDLSAAAVLWFVEPSFMPKDMLQMSLRITNYTQTRQCFVRVCVIENSIDEAAQTILLRKWTSIRKVLTPC